jgi:hypothetical protein
MLDSRPDAFFQFDQPPALLGPQDEVLFLDSPPQGLVLRLEELNLTDELVPARAGEDEEQGLEKPFPVGLLLS